MPKIINRINLETLKRCFFCNAPLKRRGQGSGGETRGLRRMFCSRECSNQASLVKARAINEILGDKIDIPGLTERQKTRNRRIWKSRLRGDTMTAVGRRENISRARVLEIMKKTEDRNIEQYGTE